MMWLLSLLPGLLPKLLDYLNKRQDTALEKYRVGAVSGKEVSIAVVQSEIARVQAQKEMNVVGMSHPIWWFAWALFVLPVGLYHFMIFFVSTFHLEFTVDRVPPVQEQWGMWIVGSIFGAQVTSGVIGQVTSAWLKKA